MSPTNWENQNRSDTPLLSPFQNNLPYTTRQTSGGIFWPSQLESNGSPEPVSASPLKSIRAPRPTKSSTFLGPANSSQKEPSTRIASLRHPFAQSQELYGTPPVPEDIRIDLELPVRQDPSSNLKLPPSDIPVYDLAAPKQELLDNDFYSDSMSKALLGASPFGSGGLDSKFPPPNPNAPPTDTTSESPFFEPPQPKSSAIGVPGIPTDVGHRYPFPIHRGFNDNDYGQAFDFEQKRTEYPSLSEIFATGRYFGSASLKFLRPAFQGNTSVFTEIAGVAENFSFGYITAPQFQIGFESRFGPGIELTYFNLRDTSRPSTFTSDGIERGTTGVWMPGANRFSQVAAANLQETLTARHRIALDSFGACFFKDFTFQRIRIDGRFGFQSVRISHELNAQVTDAGGLEVGNLRGRSDIRAFGPQFGLDYFRPIGHTKLEFLVGIGGAILFGKQHLSIENTNDINLIGRGNRELIATMNFFGGIQYRQMMTENRYLFARVGVFNQVWLNGGNAGTPQDDFGLRGFQLTVGYNR